MRKFLLVIPFLLFSLSPVEAAYLDLAWTPNQEPDVAGYRVYYGTSSRDYINFVDVGGATSYRLGDLLDGVTYYVAVTAYDTAGNESDFSAEVSGVGIPGGNGGDSPVVDGASESTGGCFVTTLFRQGGHLQERSLSARGTGRALLE